MTEVGKLLVVVGLAVAALGLALVVLGRAGFRGLPGDIVHEGEHVRVYFPIVTCLVVSVLATLLMLLVRWLRSGG